MKSSLQRRARGRQRCRLDPCQAQVQIPLGAGSNLSKGQWIREGLSHLCSPLSFPNKICTLVPLTGVFFQIFFCKKQHHPRGYWLKNSRQNKANSSVLGQNIAQGTAYKIMHYKPRFSTTVTGPGRRQSSKP